MLSVSPVFIRTSFMEQNAEKEGNKGMTFENPFPFSIQIIKLSTQFLNIFGFVINFPSVKTG